jgi:hypothetical protein
MLHLMLHCDHSFYTACNHHEAGRGGALSVVLCCGRVHLSFFAIDTIINLHFIFSQGFEVEALSGAKQLLQVFLIPHIMD